MPPTRASNANERSRALLDTIPDGLCIVSMIYDEAGKPIDYVIVEANPAFAEHTGLQEAIGKSVREAAPDIEPFWIETYGRIATTGEPERFEHQSEALGRWFEVYASRFGDPANHEVAILFRDISERRAAQRALAAATRRIDAGLMAGEVATYTWDVRSDRLWGDKNFARLFGVLTDEHDSAPLSEFFSAIHPDDAPHVRQALNATLERGAPYEVEYRVGHEESSLRWVLVRGRIVERDASGEPLVWSGVLMDITDRKHIELALRESEERFRNMADHAPVMVWISEADGSCNYLSRSWYEFTGHSPETGLGFGWLDTVHPEDRDAAHAGFLTANDRRESFSLEHRLRRSDGEYRWVIDSARPRFGPDGEFLGYIGSVLDITDRKEAEQQIRASQETFRQLVENSPFGVYVVDADFRLAVVSAGAQKVFENVRPLIGRDFAEVLRVIWPEPAATGFIALFRQTLASGRPYHSPGTVERRADVDTTDAYDWKIERIRMPDGRYGVVCHFYDLSERQRLEKALRASERNFRTLAENLPQLAWMTDASGWIFWYNRRWFEYTGTTLEEMQGWGWQKVHHPDHVQRVVDRFRRYIEDGMPWEDTFPLRSKAGEYRWFLSRAFPIRNEQNQIVRWFGTNTDITELREMDERKDRFLAVLSHELRNPLAAVRMVVQMLQNSGELPSSAANAISIVDRQTTQLVRLVDDLLEISRITRDSFELQRQTIDLEWILQSTLEAAGAFTESHSIELKFRNTAGEMLVEADPVRLVQVFSNLVGNACKYSDPGSTVDVIIERDDAQAIVRVRDTGAGIPADQTDKVFEMFAQIDPERDRKAGGLGIGLALTRGIVQLHGGTIDAHSQGEGKGSEFTVRLPLARSRTADKAAAPEAAHNVAGTRRLRVLAVDDNPDVLLVLASLLRGAGHDVLTAAGGDAALALGAAQQPDAALLDIGLPGMDGYELARQIRAAPWGESMTLIALTGWGQERDKAFATDAGFDTHLIKPASIEAIERALQAASMKVC
jgi:PAS domain S-box-containing protein